MPTYDYVCDGCGHEFETFESIMAEPQKSCPECRTDQLRRKLGPGAAILFKGTGFYQTDYRSESYKKAAKADKSPDGGSGGDSKAQSDSGGSGSGGAKSAGAVSAGSGGAGGSSSPT